MFMGIFDLQATNVWSFVFSASRRPASSIGCHFATAQLKRPNVIALSYFMVLRLQCDVVFYIFKIMLDIEAKKALKTS